MRGFLRTLLIASGRRGVLCKHGTGRSARRHTGDVGNVRDNVITGVFFLAVAGGLVSCVAANFDPNRPTARSEHDKAVHAWCLSVGGNPVHNPEFRQGARRDVLSPPPELCMGPNGREVEVSTENMPEFEYEPSDGEGHNYPK